MRYKLIPEEIFGCRHRKKRTISGRGNGPEVRASMLCLKEKSKFRGNQGGGGWRAAWTWYKMVARRMGTGQITKGGDIVYV